MTNCVGSPPFRHYVFLVLQDYPETFPAVIYFVGVSAQNIYAFVYTVVILKVLLPLRKRYLAFGMGISWKTLAECLVAIRKDKS